MNGAADLGGMQGFGPAPREENEPNFHAEWERRAFAMTLAMGATGSWTLDASRFVRESLPPAQYFSSSYYEIWLNALIRLMRERELLSAEELESGRVVTRKPVARILKAGDVASAMARGAPTEREPASPALYQPGDRVRARNMHPAGHTRLPRYLRGHIGEILRVHGVHVFPDANAHGGGENPQWLYSVRFSARELWGGRHPATDSITADCWEPYLERA